MPSTVINQKWKYLPERTIDRCQLFQYISYFLETLGTKDSSFFPVSTKVHLIFMRKAAENTDCHIIKDPANVILRAAPKMKAFNEEVKEKSEPTKSTTRVERASLGMSGTTLEP